MAQTEQSPGVVVVAGTVRSSRKFSDSYGEGRFATLIASQTPTGARSMVEVFSDVPLGQVNSQVAVSCSLAGVPHVYTVGEGDQRRRVQTARHYLNAV